MFGDLLDFGKRRTLKEAVLLFLFYATIFLIVYVVIRVLGVLI